MKHSLLFPLLTVVVFAASQSSARSIYKDQESVQPDNACEVRASVRAEDLSPDRISHGELRIKVPRAQCSQQIASVALRLQLDEFSEVKFQKKGAAVPDVRLAVNQTTLVGYEDQMGRSDYQDAMNDPALWTVRAEERRAWATEATLDGRADFSQPIVTPFTVAVPAVNYPSVLDQRWRRLYPPISWHSFGDLAYRYIAVVTFIDGRTVDVLAGHTTFVPTIHASTEQTPFIWKTTLNRKTILHDVLSICGNSHPEIKSQIEEFERCFPEAERTEFGIEITLEDGNVVQRGFPIKGRVTVVQSTGGSTISDVSLSVQTVQMNHWAEAQAAAGGDTDFYNATLPMCTSDSLDSTRVLQPESWNYQFIFDENYD
ncbi:hypothetical protein FB451DRAFT_511911 [Mycena latifolia]|nr:hypothetical protein FB451DRAFT_511911 [Mycena latifolia]